MLVRKLSWMRCVVRDSNCLDYKEYCSGICNVGCNRPDLCNFETWLRSKIVNPETLEKEKRFNLILDICREALNEYGNLEDTLDKYHVEYSLKDMLENSPLVEDLLNL